MSEGSKISYILEVNDQYTASIKDFLSHLDKITDKLKGFSSQEKKNHTARVNYSKIQREEWQEHKQWMHDERMSLSKRIFLEKQLAQTKKASALAEKDYAIAGAVNLQTLAKKQLLNKRAVNDLSLVRIEEQRIFANRMKANQMLTASAMMAPSGAYTKVAFNNQLGKFESIEKAGIVGGYNGSRRTFAGAYTPIRFDPYEGKYVGKFQPEPKDSPYKYGMAGGILGKLSGSGVMAGLGFAGAAYTVGRSVKYVHDTTVQMDSLRASLSALIPKVKGLEGATAESEVQYLRNTSNKYGLNFSNIATSYMQMLATGKGVDAKLAKGATEAIGGYSALIGLKGPALQDTMTAVQQMLTKKNLSAEEVNRQTQQLPGLKGMFFDAFYRIAQRQGFKQVTPENASEYFYKAMAKGNLDSAMMIREVIKIIFEKYGEEMIKKSHKLQGEENRLASATQKLATKMGDLAYPATLGAVKGMTSIVEGTGNFIEKMQGFGNNILTLKNALFPKEAEKPKSEFQQWRDRYGEVMLGTLGSTAKLATVGAIDYTGTLIAGGIMAAKGNTDPIKGYFDYVKDDFNKNYFRDSQGNNLYKQDIDPLVNAIKNLIGQMSQQKVEVKITTENLPDFFSVKKESNMSLWRPQTIGGR